MTIRYGRREFVKHCSALGGLAAVGGCSAAVSSSVRSSREPLRMVFYTDVHARDDEETSAALMRAAAAINAQGANLILGGGDLITGGFEATPEEASSSWDAYMAMHAAIEAEHHTVIGNHDLVGVLPSDGSPPAADPRSVYKQRLGLTKTFQAFDIMGYHFFLLDSVLVSGDDYGYHGWVSDEQQRWLEAELSRLPRAKPLVVALHIPLLTAFFGATHGSTFGAPPNRVVTNNTDVLDLFAGRNLILVLQGHLHVLELLRWQETTFITGGALSGRWWEGAFHGTGKGFSLVTLRDGRVESEYVEYG